MNPLNIRIEGDRKIVSGAFTMHDQEGFHLADFLAVCLKRDLTPDWSDFYAAAKRAGWPFERTRKLVEQSISDSDWSQTFLDTVRSVFNAVCDPDAVIRKRAMQDSQGAMSGVV